jgi:ELWxxDGT repeat protein
MVIKKLLYLGLIALALISTIAPTALAQTPCPDADMDGWAVCDAVCQVDPGDQCGDCDDGDANRYPGNTDVCDGLDNDCDGPADEDFPEVGQVCIGGIGACEATGITVCGGSGVGTWMVKDINPGPGDGAVTNPVNMDGVLLFFADDGTHGGEPWVSDGTEQGTVLLKDINPGPDPSWGHGSLPEFGAWYRPAVVGDTAFFYANDGVNGFELWKTDGTEIGTVLVKDINPGPGNSRPGGYDTPLGMGLDGVLLFGADEGINGLELWRSDGTELGTVLVKDIRPGQYGSLDVWSDIDRFTNMGGKLFLPANGNLWETDGTEKGTVPVTACCLDPSDLTVVDGTLYFIGLYEELWKSDGTEAGTVLVKDFGNATDNPNNPQGDLTDVGGTLFLRASEIDFGDELWKSDGTAEGTVRVKDIFPGSTPSIPQGLTAFQGTLFFTFLYPDLFPLWKSDGTEAGTHEVRVGGPGPGVAPDSMRNIGGTLFLSDGSLWKSDGTPQGTMRVIEGLHVANSYGFTDVNGILFFYADDGSGSGYELWASDGTIDGTECDALTGIPTPEVCGDGIDNDCEGNTDDEDTLQTWCADVDNDAHGDPDTATSACDHPAEYVAECTDCEDSNPQLWTVPGETGTVLFLGDKTTLSWEAPLDSGGSQVTVGYDVIRSAIRDYFMEGSACVYDGNQYVTTRTDDAVPAPGIAWYYLVKAWNNCGGGPVGTKSSGAERRARDCH